MLLARGTSPCLPGIESFRQSPRAPRKQSSTHYSQKQQARRRAEGTKERKEKGESRGSFGGQAGLEGVQGALEVCGVFPSGWGSPLRFWCALFMAKDVCVSQPRLVRVRQQRWKSQKKTSHILRAVIANPHVNLFSYIFRAGARGDAHLQPRNDQPESC